MSAKWHYENENIAYADGTGTYEKGWYAASPSTVEAGGSPDAGPFSRRPTAEKRAKELARDEHEASVSEVAE